MYDVTTRTALDDISLSFAPLTNTRSLLLIPKRFIIGLAVTTIVLYKRLLSLVVDKVGASQRHEISRSDWRVYNVDICLPLNVNVGIRIFLTECKCNDRYSTANVAEIVHWLQSFYDYSNPSVGTKMCSARDRYDE